MQLADQAGSELNGGGLDTAAYSTALQPQLVDLKTALASTAIDQIAASFRIRDFQRNPVGTGPYKFVKYIAGQSVELARFDDYFGGAEKTKVGPAKVFIPIIKDAASASAALQKGDINWQTEITSDALSTLKKDPNLQIAEFADFGYYFIAFNLRAPHIYSDLALRQAFSMCIDHDATVTAATDGNGVPVGANTPPASWAYNADVPKYTLDTAAAMKLIEAAGWTKGSDGVFAKAGKRLSSDLYVRSGRPQRVAFARLAKDQLAKCGIEINVKESDFATVLLPLLSYPNKFDTYMGGWSTSIDPDDYSIFHSSKATTKENPDANNFVGWTNPAADKLLTDGRPDLDRAKPKARTPPLRAAPHPVLPYPPTGPATARRSLIAPGPFDARFRDADDEPADFQPAVRPLAPVESLPRQRLSVPDPCTAVGSASLRSFSSRFTEIVGTTPSLYRARDHSAHQVIPPCVSRVATRPRRKTASV